MIFETINTKSLSIVGNNQLSLITVRTSEKGFYFSVAASKVCGMSKGKYVHFMRGKREKNQYTGCWYFVVNDDKDGFKVTESSHEAHSINNRPMGRLFMQATKCDSGDTFYIQKTESTHNECPVFEILVHKSIGKIGK